jgi:pimeloyl-ACP methyl ester carboxylesterase
MRSIWGVAKMIVHDVNLAEGKRRVLLNTLLRRANCWNRPGIAICSTIAFLLANLVAASPAKYQPIDQFSTINGVTLQHLDWGGQGPTILLLPGLGDDVHQFDAFAPHFTDRFHVVGLSRRGQGASDKPASGYDTNTLVEDIRGFLDAIHLDRVDIIGHSIAGVEMTLFAAKYPGRLRHLVYLDAAYDMGAAYIAALKAKLILEASPPRTPLELIEAEANRTHLDYRTVQAPALAFFVINEHPESPWYLPFERGYKGDQIKQFKRDMKRGEAIEYHDTGHLFFNDPKKVETVVQHIRAFLLRP